MKVNIKIQITNFIDNILVGKDKIMYPVLDKYLQNKIKKSKDEEEDSEDNNENNYSLDKLNLFNNVYLNHISKELAERQPIEKSEIYLKEENAKLIDSFIEFYNGLKIVDNNGNELELNVEKNFIIDFLIIDDNKYGKSYKEIYKIFVDKQNNELKGLLNLKISSGELNPSCKKSINVQQVKENEIFSFNKEKENAKILFNSSYRKYIDTRNHENYNEYEIRLKQIESEMTSTFLENKRLLNYNIKDFYFNNEVFSCEISNLLSDFKYKTMGVSDEEMVVIYDFIIKYDGNLNVYKDIIKNFITLIKYLNKVNGDNNAKINENTKICDIVKNLQNISKEFNELFQDKKDKNNKSNINVNLNVSKIINVFDYFLKLIFKDVKKDIEKHQEKNMKGNSAYNYNDKDMIIKKKDLASALRKFITLVLFREEENDKDKKIKSNTKNIFDYLKNKDLWEKLLYEKLRFEEDLTKLKDLNIPIKEILFFYYYLLDGKDEGFDNKVKEYIRKKENKTKSKPSIRKPSITDTDDESEESESEDEDQKTTKKQVKKEEIKKEEEDKKKVKKDEIVKIERKKSERKVESGTESESESESEERTRKVRKKNKRK